MIVQINQSLAKLNTFGIDQKASRLIWAHSSKEIANYLKHHGAPALVLGGGSNLLLTKDVEGDVLKVDIHGRKLSLKTMTTFTSVLVQVKIGTRLFYGP